MLCIITLKKWPGNERLRKYYSREIYPSIRQRYIDLMDQTHWHVTELSLVKEIVNSVLQKFDEKRYKEYHAESVHQAIDATSPATSSSSAVSSVSKFPSDHPCWFCNKPKGQGPDRCSGHYKGTPSDQDNFGDSGFINETKDAADRRIADGERAAGTGIAGSRDSADKGVG